MPIIIQHGSPLLVAGAAMGAGLNRQQVQQTQLDRQGLDQAFDIANTGLQQRRQGMAFAADQALQQDQLKLDVWGKQLGQFNADRGYGLDQQQLAMQQQGQAFDQQQQLGQVNREQQERQMAINTINEMAKRGFVDPAQAAAWTGATQLGGNPFGQPTAYELDRQEANKAGFEQMQLEGRLTQEQIRQQGGVEKERIRQQEITKRNAGGESPSQARLRANDEYQQERQQISAEIDGVKADMAAVDDQIKLLASKENPRRARNEEDQQRLDQLYALRGQMAGDGTATGLVAKLREGQDRLKAVKPASLRAATPATQPAAPVKLSSDDAEAERQFASLPSGASFIAPDGSLRKKP
jgi:hypothetical protein